MNEFKPDKFIKKFHAGDKLSNKQLLQAQEFFTDLENKLRQCGPLYQVSAVSIRRMLITIESYIDARKITQENKND